MTDETDSNSGLELDARCRGVTCGSVQQESVLLRMTEMELRIKRIEAWMRGHSELHEDNQHR